MTLEPPHFFVRKSSSNRRRIWSPESMNRKWCTEDICGYLVVWGTWWILGKIPIFFYMDENWGSNWGSYDLQNLRTHI